ncbi:hemogen [Rhinoderma darwinii]|uniref:hemogen n=1 Tax=Rhinoderma darwinii TaxID=43563 RepID=UPI003F6738BA
MGDIEKDHHYSELSGTSAPAAGHHEEKQESPVNITRRLRDREMLKRKKQEAQEKDTYHEQTSSKRQRKTKGTGRGRRMQVKEPEPETEHEPVHELPHDPRQEEQQHETVAEKKCEFLSDLLQEHVEQEQEPHHEDSVPTVTEGETANMTLLIHEDADGHVPQETTFLLTDKEEVAVSDPAPVTEETEIIAFPLEQEQEEHQYYTPLL